MTVNPKATLVQPGKGATYLALGDLYTFLATGQDTDGKYALFEMVLQPQSITPQHIMWVTPPGGEQFYAEVGQLVNLPMSEEEKRRLSVTPTPADMEKIVELAVTKYKVKLVSPASSSAS